MMEEGVQSFPHLEAQRGIPENLSIYSLDIIFQSRSAARLFLVSWDNSQSKQKCPIPGRLAVLTFTQSLLFQEAGLNNNSSWERKDTHKEKGDTKVGKELIQFFFPIVHDFCILQYFNKV